METDRAPLPISPFQALRRSFWLIVQSAPLELRNLIALNLISGAGPSAALFLSKIIIDEASRLLAKGDTADAVTLLLSQPILLGSIGGFIIINLLHNSIETIQNAVFSTLRDRLQGVVQGRVIQKVATFDDIALFETPELLNLVQLAEQGVQHLQELALIFGITIIGFFTFVPSLILSGTIAWWVMPVLFLSAIPSIYVEFRFVKVSWGIESGQASGVREMNLYAKVLTGSEYAKEIRLFGLQSLWIERWQRIFWGIFNQMQQVRRRETLAVFAWSFLSGLGIAIPFIYVVVGVVRGRYTLGDLALYVGLIEQVRRSLRMLISNSSDLYENALKISPIFQILELNSNLKITQAALNDRDRTPAGIEINELSFSYPGSDKLILENINLNINYGEMVAIVGENGAGKTTLAKLLCRLYDPSSGSIEWGGKDLRDFQLEELRSRMAVVMQDFARFPATVRENVGFGDLLSLQDGRAIENAIIEAGIASKIQTLPQGLDTFLGKQLEGGIDLSGGQWQRIAIARALMRNARAELLIFDEPTAALDPKTEHEIYNIFRKIAKGKMALVISHRLALAKIANLIAVMENGKIVEMGTHDELMALGDRYCTMFTRQASSYI